MKMADWDDPAKEKAGLVVRSDRDREVVEPFPLIEEPESSEPVIYDFPEPVETPRENAKSECTTQPHLGGTHEKLGDLL